MSTQQILTSSRRGPDATQHDHGMPAAGGTGACTGPGPGGCRRRQNHRLRAGQPARPQRSRPNWLPVCRRERQRRQRALHVLAATRRRSIAATGETGAVSRILPDGGFKRVITGLPSLALAERQCRGRARWTCRSSASPPYVTMSWGAIPPIRATLGGLVGLVWHAAAIAHRSGASPTVVADISAARSRTTTRPGGNVDSNPYGTGGIAGTPRRRGCRCQCPHRGARQRPHAHPRRVAVAAERCRRFPAPREPVPTSVDGRSGWRPVRQPARLAFPFWAGHGIRAARVAVTVVRIKPFVTGLTAVVDVGVRLRVARSTSSRSRQGQTAPFPPPPPNPGLGDRPPVAQVPGRQPS